MEVSLADEEQHEENRYDDDPALRDREVYSIEADEEDRRGYNER